jgi:hypothetical protein
MSSKAAGSLATARSEARSTQGSHSPPSTPLAGSGAARCYKRPIAATPDPCAPSAPGPECSDCDRRRDDLPQLAECRPYTVVIDASVLSIKPCPMHYRRRACSK